MICMGRHFKSVAEEVQKVDFEFEIEKSGT